MMARDRSGLSPASKAMMTAMPAVEGFQKPASPRKDGNRPPENLLIVGFGLNIGPMLVELDAVVPLKSRVIILSPVPTDTRVSSLERTQRRWQHHFKNINIEHVEGMLGSPTAIDRLKEILPLQNFNRVFVLPDRTADDSRHADACSLAAVLQIRKILALQKAAKPMPIVPELQDRRTEKLCEICKVCDYIDSAEMPVQVLASVCYQPRLRPVLRGLLSEDSPVKFMIRTLDEYLPEGIQLPKKRSFLQVQSLAFAVGDVVIGWTKEEEAEVVGAAEAKWQADKSVAEIIDGINTDAHGALPRTDFEFNPLDKTAERKWCDTDRLIVLATK
jgi:hypothetical protein